MDPNPFPPSAIGRGGINPFANWRNHPDFEEEEHKEEGLPRPYKMEHEIDHAQPEQGQNLHHVNSLNGMGALQRMIREMMEPKARRGERPTYRKPYPPYIDQIPLSPGFKVPNFTLFNGEDPHASSIEHIGSLPANTVQTWEQMEIVFHDYYFRIQPEVTISDLLPSNRVKMNLPKTS
ncbi:unnamed protein product [Prunus armeniaca]